MNWRLGIIFVVVFLVIVWFMRRSRSGGGTP
jgi:hypothetical protein